MDPSDHEVEQLRLEIESQARQYGPGTAAGSDNHNRLCTVQNKLANANSTFDNRLKCTYKTVKLPYYRFKKELVSISPYVCLFYDVTNDEENVYLMDFVSNRLERGRVQSIEGPVENEGRISDHSFVWDYESDVVSRLSQKVSYITDLETVQQPGGVPFSAEALQVVNYGVGGHYVTHMDTFQEDTVQRMDSYMPICGNRLATFLIYLTDVERGGATVFPRIDIAVRPVKNAALFWYSTKPSGEQDYDTHHAGCPVVVGHKWVSNKWIWTFGNTFTRRCGLTPDATQLDIDEHMERHWI